VRDEIDCSQARTRSIASFEEISLSLVRMTQQKPRESTDPVNATLLGGTWQSQ
jgi:hypothetical protein